MERVERGGERRREKSILQCARLCSDASLSTKLNIIYNPADRDRHTCSPVERRIQFLKGNTNQTMDQTGKTTFMWFDCI